MWEEKDGALRKTFVFTDFAAAFGWMVMVAMEAERQNHHPEWSNTYNRVNVRLSTHDAGNVVTEKDRQLAESMDTLFERLG